MQVGGGERVSLKTSAVTSKVTIFLSLEYMRQSPKELFLVVFVNVR